MTERWKILQGDCLPLMREMPDASVHAVVTDPPYGLSEHAPAEVLACLSAWCRGEEYQPTGRGFMGKAWDAWVPGPAYWREALRVLKPGGHLLAFAGSRTQDLMGMSLRLAGFEIRDCIMWVFGSGFPKSLDISKAIDAAAGAERQVVGTGKGRTGSAAQPHGASFSDDAYQWPGEFKVTTPATPEAEKWAGWGTALKPAYEPIIVARKPLGSTVAACVLEHGTGGLNIDGCRVEGAFVSGWSASGSKASENRAMSGGNTERAPMPDNPAGRWPANLAHDGSPEALAGFPDSEGSGPARALKRGKRTDGDGWGMADELGDLRDAGSGSAARFFYCAKASKEDRDEGLSGLPLTPSYMVENGSKTAAAANGVTYERHTLNRNAHPTVKPTDLMRWLVRLVTPPGGIVLDPFCGSGSTGKAAMLEGFRFIGIEREEASADTARLRVAHAAATPVQLDIFTPAAPVVAPAPRVDDRQPSLFESAGG